MPLNRRKAFGKLKIMKKFLDVSCLVVRILGGGYDAEHGSKRTLDLTF